jgi:uncharacterized cupredoxin-like copper-binding protein
MRRYRLPSALLIALLMALSGWLGASTSTPRALADSSTPAASEAHCPSPLDTMAATPAASPTAMAEATPSAEPVCVGIVVEEFAVRPRQTTLRVNQPYIFAVGNAGKLTHELVIEKAGADDKPLEVEVNGKEQESEAEDIAPGETKELAWTFTEPGHYQFSCHVPDHFEAGMVVEFEVLP